MRKKLLSLVIAICVVFSVFTCVSADSNSGVEGFVTRLYEVCLDRTPDQAGLDSWTGNLRSGAVTGSDVARGFIFSSEFTSRNLDNNAFVTCLYNTMFGRGADEAGLS